MSSSASLFATFSLQDYVFGIDVLRVQEVLRYQDMTPVPLSPDVVAGLINLRGQIVTALDMRRRLNLPPREPDRQPMNVVVRTAEGAISLLVDEIGDVVEADPEAFEPPPCNVDAEVRELLSGVIKLKDKLLLIVDADQATDGSGRSNFR
jgi:purine-binding chemotaxis protein CheW